ncbi:MAG TPA: SIR2 family protein [Kofleriaceae bacterium]|nr:SIR2 family protein [Kofleriaceae bacterium]
MNEALVGRGREGDDAASKDLDKLLHKGSLVRAVGFLARSLGEESCDKIVAETWASPAETPALPKLLARLPFRHVWTTFPGDVLENAFEAESPSEWPPARVVTYQELGELSPRRRTLVKMLGNFDTYVVTPHSVRRALSRAVDLREYARELYVEGTLIFVGFRHGDPDLAALLDRVFGMFEPPRGTHYFLGAGVGPVTVDELMAEHHISVVNLPGKGGDESSDKAVIEWLENLATACKKAGVSLEQGQPDADDLEGWVAMLGDSEHRALALDAIDLIERRAKEARNSDRVVECMLGKIEHAEDDNHRAALLRQLAEQYETNAGDLRRAFEAVTTACRMNPAENEYAQAAERLAAATGNWSELVSEASEIANEVQEKDRAVAANWWARLGRWYGEKLDRADYAMPSLRRALELDPVNREALTAQAEILRKGQKWSELADTLKAHAEVEADTDKKVDLLLGLGDLQETQLASTAKAIEAYQAAADLDPNCDDALAALERLYRRDERWANLAKVLDRRAEVIEAAGEAGRAAAIRRELATLRAEKLGDLEGAIARYEATVAQNGADQTALKALVELYDKTGRTDDYLRTMERLAAVAPDAEKLATLRKLAAELEDKDGAADRAISTYEKILAVDSNADDAYRGLARVLRSEAKWYELVALYDRHIAAAKQPAQRVELYLEAANVNEKELSDPHRAIEAHRNALAIDENNKSSLAALSRLYQRTEAYDRAVDMLVRHAALAGDTTDKGAGMWAEAGRLASENLDDNELAQRHLEKALALDAEHFGALKALAGLHQRKGSWSSAVEFLQRAEAASANRSERVELIFAAAQIADHKLNDQVKAQELYDRLLKLDPDHVEAGQRVADRLVAAGRWDEAVPVLEMLARRSEGQGDRFERSRREAQLGKAYEMLHRTEKAARHYRLAVEAEPESLDAAVGLAGVLMIEAKAQEGQAGEGAADLWKEVDKRYREILARHRTGLADGQVADIWYRLGVCARAQGDDRNAQASFRRALEREALHAPSLQGLVEVAAAKADWRTVVDAKRSLVEATPDDQKAKLLEEIGDTYREKLKDSANSISAYLEGLKMQPGSRVLLHKLLEAYTEQKQWRRAVETLDQLGAQETSMDRRARFHYTAAVIARDEVHDVDLAVERFHAALDDDPTTQKAFEAIEKLLTERKEWKGLARAYRKQIKRLGEDAPTDKALALWTKLGDVCADHLGDNEAATEAYQVACELAPEDMTRHEQLADLYLEAGEVRRVEAIRELQFLLTHSPDRVELYKALSSLYLAEHELDKAWCVAQVLSFLGAASAEETALFQRYRTSQFVPATRRLTEELWQKSIIHSREDRHVGAIFASTLMALAGSSAQPASAFGLDANGRTDLESDTRLPARVVKYVSGVLALEPSPMVWIQETGDGLRVANTIGMGADQKKLVPSLLVGAPQVTKTDERELAFEVGKRLAYLRPERFASLAMGSLPKLEAAFAAAVLAGGHRVIDHEGNPFDAKTDDARKMAATLRQAVPSQLLEQVGEISSKLSGRVGNGLITGWRTGTDLTANRVGFIVCNDFETASRGIATEGAAMSTLSVKERLRDLLAYAVSDSYFTVRRHLGIHVRDEASA